MKNRKIYIGLFLSTLLLCVFFVFPTPAEAVTEDGKVVIVLDPGHGGYDPGAVNGKTYERENALRIAQMMKEILEDHGGFEVHLTRETNDLYLTRQKRAEIADSYNADFVMSLHFNSHSNKKIGGAQVCISVQNRFAMKTLGRNVSAALHDKLGVKDRGLLAQPYSGTHLYYWSDEYGWDKPYDNSVGTVADYYGLINWCCKYGIPSVIVEHCYISNDTEVELIRNEETLALMAQADAEAIIAYYGEHEHSYGGFQTDYPTSCVLAGKKSKHCRICGARKDVTPLSATPNPDKHLWYVIDETKATCAKEGLRTHYCAYAKGMIDSFVEMDLHVWEEKLPSHTYELTDTVPPVHTTDGYKEYTCDECGHVKQEVLQATETHSFLVEVSRTDATCLAPGTVVYKCNVCPEEREEPLPQLTEHRYSESGICTVCGAEAPPITEELITEPQETQPESDPSGSGENSPADKIWPIATMIIAILLLGGSVAWGILTDGKKRRLPHQRQAESDEDLALQNEPAGKH